MWLNPNIRDLQYCFLLEELEISGLELPKEEDQSAATMQIDQATFLPLLKKFKTYTCLGIYSLLFEEKKSLIHLRLQCSHILTKDCKLKWMETSNVWQDIQELNIFSTVSLTLANLFVIVPRLRKLKSLTLSDQMLQSQEERDRAQEFIAKLKQDPSNVILTIFDCHGIDLRCYFQKLN